MGSGLILGIESSCDETAAAVVKRGAATCSSIVASQISTHAPYGGVVPELASREHLRNVVPIVRAALAEAGCGLADLDAVAVTSGPGLAGALLVGITYAKALAFARNIPLIAVNHLEGHIHAVLLQCRESAGQTGESGQPRLAAAPGSPAGDDGALPMPALALVVSGGHTHLYLARPPAAGTEVGAWQYSLIGRTLDDAAGEAFDKVAKLLGLGYPGGPWIDQPGAVRQFKGCAVRVRADQEQGASGRQSSAHQGGARTAPIAELDRHFLFSFSGIKTAVLRYVEVHGMRASCEVRQKALMAIPNPHGKTPDRSATSKRWI